MIANFSDRLNRLTESKTLEMARLARELQAKGIDVVNLSIGQPDFETPPHIKVAAKKAIDENYTGYTPVPGYPELREAVCQKFKRENGLDFKQDQIIISTGAKQSLSNIALSLINDGDEAVIPAPFWVTYPEQIEMAGGTPKFIQTGIEDNFKVKPSQLDAALSDKTKLFIFSSPSNPTGNIYSKEELASLVEVFEKYPNVTIVSDEIYEHINYIGKHESIGQFESIRDRLIIVNGVSKAFAMTGWRIGYIAAPRYIAEACNRIQGQITSGACSISQRAAIEALTGDMTPTYEMNKAFSKRRELVLGMLRNIPGLKVNEPDGAFYFFPDMSHYFGKSNGEITIKNPDDFCTYLLDKFYVSAVTGSAFGDSNCFRISYASSDEELIKGLTRIQAAFAELSSNGLQ